MRIPSSAAFAAALFLPSAVQATTVFDAVGDFAPGYTGAAADLDVTSFGVNYDGANRRFLIGATMAGIINPATIGLYAIGVNTGTGIVAPFTPQGAPNVRFNQVVVVNKNGTARVGDNDLTATINGNRFDIAVPEALLTSTGFAASQYTWNLWPRTGLGTGTVATDFAPDNAMLLGSVPEPGTWAMMIGGFAASGVALRRRRSARVALA
jgi:hypothetical protein